MNLNFNPHNFNSFQFECGSGSLWDLKGVSSLLEGGGGSQGSEFLL